MSVTRSKPAATAGEKAEKVFVIIHRSGDRVCLCCDFPNHWFRGYDYHFSAPNFRLLRYITFYEIGKNTFNMSTTGIKRKREGSSKKGFSVGPSNLPDGTYKRKSMNTFEMYYRIC